ncbi:hypothetical protein [Arthrobacter sp. StoSoilA2]|uniref:hypothetical protein n=1 Tax=Arthrobacter sp. StoSoilA2 TaxID=2830990 RepID=UPI001CC58718|nr:hypothetical protein [Arthrobacter sp. StoSoilA2]
MSPTPVGPLPAGRHYRRRRLRLSLPSVPARTSSAPITDHPRPSSAPIPIVPTKSSEQQQFKRRVALVLVVLVVVAVPALLAVLLLAG